MKYLTPGLIVAAMVCLLGAVGAGLGLFDDRSVEPKGVTRLPRDAEQTAALLAMVEHRVPLVLRNENRFQIRLVGDDAC
jgi:hypothetical protein